MHNTTMPLNVIDLLSGVIPMTLTLLFMQYLKISTTSFTYNEDHFIYDLHT
jgi:hypothetical protein